MTEVELAKKIILYLNDLKWDVYQEVQLHRNGPIADIVAVQNGLVWIIEVKKSFSLAVLDQILEWPYYGNYVSIAALPSKKDNKFVLAFMKNYGIGHLVVSQFDNEVNEKIMPFFNRKAFKNSILKILKDEHKTFAEAGNNYGKHFTPFQNTVFQIQTIVEQNQGILFKDLLNRIKHHYHNNNTARACLLKWISDGILKGITIKKDNKDLKVYFNNEKVSNNSN